MVVGKFEVVPYRYGGTDPGFWIREVIPEGEGVTYRRSFQCSVEEAAVIVEKLGGLNTAALQEEITQLQRQVKSLTMFLELILALLECYRSDNPDMHAETNLLVAQYAPRFMAIFAGKGVAAGDSGQRA